MPLKLVTGPANSAKAGEVLGDLRARLEQDPILVVPSFEDVEHNQRELAERGAVFGARVLLFKGLFDLVNRHAGVGRAPIASTVQRELVADRAVREAELRVLSGSAEHPGFLRAVVRFAEELERSMIGPERLERALAEWAGSGPRRTYAREVAAVYAGYARGLEAAGLVDDALYQWRALNVLSADPGSWGSTPVFLYGFDDFTPLELEAIDTLAGRAGAHVVVSFPFEPGREAFKALATVHQELLRIAGHEELAQDATSDHYAERSRTALHALERRLYEPGGRAVKPGAAVRLHAAGGERAEVELVAAEVLGELRAGVEPGDVAVVFRDPGGYGSLVEQVFDSYGVPFAMERRTRLAHTSVGRGLLALLRCARPGGAAAADLLAYLRTPGRLRRPELADVLEARVRVQGASGSDAAREHWERINPRFPLDEIDRLRAARGDAAFLAGLERQLEVLFTAAYERRAPVLDADELDDPRAYRAAREAIQGMRAVTDAGLRVDRARIEETLRGLEVRLGEAVQPGRVRVTGPEGVRGRRFQCVFLCGLQEGEFPRRARSEPFLPDEDRVAVPLPLQLREQELERERYLFYVCASRAERLLVLSSRVSDEEGAPQAASFLLDDVRDVFTDALDRDARTRSLSDVAWAPAEAPTRREWERALAAEGPTRDQVPPSPLRDPGLLEELRGGRSFSATALETYADCPVKWLVDRLVSPEALEPDPEQMVRGSYAHEVLETTFRRLAEETGSARVTPGSLQRAEAILLQAIEDGQERFQISPKQTRVRTAVRKLQFDLLRYLGAEAGRDGDFEPTHFELRFGVGGDRPAASLGLHDVAVSGTIDRVDVRGGQAVVRDYKSGRTTYPVARWVRDRRLQTALYMLAVEELLGLEAVGGVYQQLAGTDLRPRGLLLDDAREEIGSYFVDTDWCTPEQFRGHLEAARTTAGHLIEGIRSGALRPCPDTCSYRGGCSYPSICRAE